MRRRSQRAYAHHDAAAHWQFQCANCRQWFLTPAYAVVYQHQLMTCSQRCREATRQRERALDGLLPSRTARWE